MNKRLLLQTKKLSLQMRALPVNRAFLHFSFLIRKNNILSIGVNRADKTHPLAKKFNYKYATQHSELNAICNFNGNIQDLKKCVLVNTRLGAGNNFLLSKPCLNCQLLVLYFGIEEVYYTDQAGEFSCLQS